MSIKYFLEIFWYKKTAFVIDIYIRGKKSLPLENQNFIVSTSMDFDLNNLTVNILRDQISVDQ